MWFPCEKTERRIPGCHKSGYSHFHCLSLGFFQRIVKIESTPIESDLQPRSRNCGNSSGWTSETTQRCLLTTPILSAHRSPPARCPPAGHGCYSQRREKSPDKLFTTQSTPLSLCVCLLFRHTWTQ